MKDKLKALDIELQCLIAFAKDIDDRLGKVESLKSIGTCGRCLYYDPCSELDKNGRCRCNAPVALEKGKYGEFPLVYVTDWCGEWRCK